MKKLTNKKNIYNTNVDRKVASSVGVQSIVKKGYQGIKINFEITPTSCKYRHADNTNTFRTRQRTHQFSAYCVANLCAFSANDSAE